MNLPSAFKKLDLVGGATSALDTDGIEAVVDVVVVGCKDEVGAPLVFF